MKEVFFLQSSQHQYWQYKTLKMFRCYITALFQVNEMMVIEITIQRGHMVVYSQEPSPSHCPQQSPHTFG